MIRKLETNDLNACVSIHRSSFKQGPWLENWSYEDSIARLIDLQSTPRFYGLVYCDNNQVVGALLGNVEQMNGFQIYFLKEMFVSPSYKNRGVGRELLKSLDTYLLENGIDTAMLYTSSELGVDKFYLKQGYKKESELVLLGKRINE